MMVVMMMIVMKKRSSLHQRGMMVMIASFSGLAPALPSRRHFPQLQYRRARVRLCLRCCPLLLAVVRLSLLLLLLLPPRRCPFVSG